VSLVHVVAIGIMRWGVYALVGDHYDPWSPLTDWPYELRKDLVVYAAVVAIYVAWRRLRAGPPAAAGQPPDVLEVRDGARRHFVPLIDVVWVEAAGNYVELHRGGTGLLHRASLSEMQRRLQGAGFVRIHRSRLVRREAVAAVESKPTGDFVVRLRDGRELAGSRRYRRPLLAD
jgi:DNA-binding LytR/AlgR family response regulator